MSVFTKSGGAEYAKKSDVEFSYVDRNLKSMAFIVVAVGLILAVAVFAVVLMAKSRKSASSAAKKNEKEKTEEENYEKIIED